jgi:hypothetical protein
MLKKLGAMCAALVLASAAFSSPAHSRGGAHFSRGGTHFGGGGTHFGAPRVGGIHYGGARFGAAHYGGARVGGVYRGGARVGYGPYRGRYYAGGYRGRYYGHGYWGPYYRGGYDYDDWGYYAGALAAGVLLGGVVAAQPYYYDDFDAVRYCMRRFKSYDPNTGTYLGYDGYRHPCP